MQRYCKASTFLDAIPNSNQSTIWRDTLKGRDLLIKGLKIYIANGQGASFWFNYLVGESPFYKIHNINIPNNVAH